MVAGVLAPIQPLFQPRAQASPVPVQLWSRSPRYWMSVGAAFAFGAFAQRERQHGAARRARLLEHRPAGQ
jgi:hypothetical protein